MSNKLYTYDKSLLDYILEDVRTISFLYSYKMDIILNKHLRNQDNSKEINQLIDFLLSNDCNNYYFHDEFVQDENFNYCLAFKSFLVKLSLYIDNATLTPINLKTIVIPAFYKTLMKISTYFTIKNNIIGFRVIIVPHKKTPFKDKGFISVSIDPTMALYIFGYLQFGYKQYEQGVDYDIYFYKIKIKKGTPCIPITSLGTIDFKEQEILFTNKFFIDIEKIEPLKNFNYSMEKLKKNEKINFLNFLKENKEKIFIVESNLKNID